MFEAHVLHLLRRYLGEYVHGLSAEALRISVWKGDVVLKDLKLKAEALNLLKLPVTVKAGFVGTITLKVPWKSLGKEPVIVLIDRVFVLAHPASDYRTLKEEDREKLLEAKLQQIEEAETATIEAIAKSKLGTPPPGNSWLGSLIGTIIGNLKISISNVHIRYEDCDSNIGSPFSAGVTLAKLAAVTMDDQENETFDTSGALDRLRKSVQLERLAVYHDSNSLPWTIDKRWEDLSPKEWIEIFEDGINDPIASRDIISKRARTRSYIVSPINGVLKYHRLGKQERNDPETPFERASVTLSDVSLTVTEAQYHDWIKLLEVVSRYRIYVEVSHLRPMVPASEGPHLWWRYAAQASLQQKKMCYRFSWDQIRHLCQLRRRYVQLYASFLQRSSDVKNSDLREIERDLDPKVIILWRLLAHAKVESVRSKEAAEQRMIQKRSWFSFRRQTTIQDTSGDASEGSELAEGKLSKEEWQAINNLLSYQQDEELALHPVKDMQNMIRFLVAVSIGQAAARIINRDDIEIVCARFEQLHVSTKLRHRSTHCDVSLKFYGLSAPEGSLAQSVSSEQKVNALVANFVSSPAGENVDWKLSATTSPCHVTVFIESYNRFMEFVRRSNAVSPTVTLETAAALQTKIEKVTRRAQEQFQMVLEEKSRFALDIDLDAPKIRVPIRACDSSKCESHLLFDLGNFTLRTKDSNLEDQRQNIYSRFYISGRDIAACFTECGSDCHSGALFLPSSSNHPPDSPLVEKAENFCSLIDSCSVAVIVDQLKVPHPSYPSTRISIQVPNLGIHFSPSRYHRLMGLLNIWYGTMEIPGQAEAVRFQTELARWRAIDLANDARILVWRGIGNSMAKWQPCYLLLSGFHLYVLESANSQSYQRCLSMAGRQIHEVPPANVGGSPFCVAVSFRGMHLQKALEMSSTWVLEFQDEDEKSAWLKGLIQATYQASAPPSVNVLGETGEGVSESSNSQISNSRTADLVINGSLVETKLFIYSKTGEIGERDSEEEALILELLADGGKVHVICWEGDLAIKTKLHSLKIKDELQGRVSACSEYLAYSVQKHENLAVSPGLNESNSTVMSNDQIEEDDIFRDALPDFMSTDSPSARTGDINDFTRFDSSDASVSERDFGKGRGISADVFYEAEDSDSSDFVSVNFSTRSSGSSDYDGIDTQMTVSMSKLEFFCNRPTVVALIGFGMDLSSASNEGGQEANVQNTSETEDLLNREKVDDSWHVKGLLGYGKDRVVFNLRMNVASVCLFLNKEDGSQLAMLVQENFLLDIKVYPSSLSIEGTLGNFRLCDKSLGADSCWSWLCDIRNPDVDSLIKFKLNSYSAEDDDYEGYDYSLHGRLSAVRIVFLYRFVQEVTVYFMGLASPQTEEAIKLVDKVGGFEWLIQKYEIDGSSALKLDLSLDTPIIVVPKTSVSKDFIQLDLGQLQVRNELRWHGYPEKDPSAVRVDVLHAEILGINMTIGIDGRMGKPMIRKGQGLDVFVRRSLRDVFRKVPNFSVEVKIGLLHGVMSDKEYNVIRDCLYMNLCEVPRLPPSFRGSSSSSKDTMRLLVDKVNMNSQMLLSRTVTMVAVEVKYALLELCNGIGEESPLACIALERLWVSYRMTSLSETDLYITIPTFSILDIRPETKSEMRLMLGSSSDSSKPAAMGDFPYSSNSYSVRRKASEVGVEIEVPSPTMFLMDYRYRMSSQSYVVRIQQPKILVVPDFLLALGEFFVPALGAITGREEALDPKNDPITKSENIILSEPVYKQHEDVVCLSPNRQLVADALGVDEYIYDGCGNAIYLSASLDSSDRCEPVIIIGRGKKLRFVNVKIENGSLLKKCTYLSNDSSYSVAFEDGVDILSPEKSVTDNEHMDVDQQAELSDIRSPHFPSQSDSSSTQSFTFEGQVLSPEFTFYDSTKSCLDDSSQGEKLLRAKMDFSFMYAAKENDTWIRALVKDLMIESGSGLMVLDPVDLSGGYTSVKEKTSISLLSTDICIHLSLNALSLVINLLNQVSVALQFGNTIPLAPCTNFDRVWVSPEENGPCYNLTFWRPRAPSNYVVLGDCVTSRPIPPSQAVMAVSNTYGRVRKPIGFNLIGRVSNTEGFERNEGHMSADADGTCSIWMPVPPPGYKALGFVANLGDQPPPNHIVFCLRSDLVTSAMYSECIYTVAPNLMFPSGFSIWRLDNVVGSFCASPTINSPPKDYGLDLSHVILWSSSQHFVSSKESASLGSRQDDHNGSQQIGVQSVSSPGWDVLRSISKATNCYMSTPRFERIWWDKGNDVRRPVSIWRPVARSGYAVLGDCITEGLEPPALGIIFKADNPDTAAKPVQFSKVAQIVGRGLDEIFFWYPVPPPGYVTLGCVVSRGEEPPSSDLFCCPRMDLVNQANIFEVPISRSSSSRAAQCWSIWRVENQACTFLARSDLKKPSSRLAYTICDSVKPKTRENVSAEVRLRRFSLTVLDSFCGMMTPLFDTTITNIKLATHGRLEAMNAVLISSIAASTFNTQQEAWEPLVEPFDGIFKLETYATNEHASAVIGKRVHVSATSILNINVSAANLETFAETAVSWRRIMELEDKAAKLNQEVGQHYKNGEDQTLSALDEDDFQNIVVENKLGCDLYLKKMDENVDTVELLHHDDHALVWVPPPRFSDRLNVADEFREPRHYLSIQIIEAKGLPTEDDGNSHNFFCALRLVVNNQAIDQQKLFPQSARTRCVKPVISKDEAIAKWNELFVFEVPRKGSAKLEVEVTNLAAKAGKGEVVGAFSFPVGHGAGTLKKVASGRILHQPYDALNVVSYPLKRRVQQNNIENVQDCGAFSVSTQYFERKSGGKISEDVEHENDEEKDVGFWVGINPDGAWEGVRSLLPVSVVPKSFHKDFIAMEVIMKNGKKHAVFRGLVTVVNDSDVELEVAVCPLSLIKGTDSSTSSRGNIFVEEVFQNQFYHPTNGWGSKHLGSQINDPGHWSTRDFSYSSKDFFEPPLPLGWQWTSTWTIDKSHSVDSQGWAYGPDFQSLRWPPTSKSSMKSASDTVRRRRWTRPRMQLMDQTIDRLTSGLTTINPGCSAVLPWKSTLRNSEDCFLVRPYVDPSQTPYSWGRAVALSSYSDQSSSSRQTAVKQGDKLLDYIFKLNQLEKKDILLTCSPSMGNKQFWLSVGTDASVLHTELNAPIYDWRISVNSPLELENRLPSSVEFTLWERTKEGSFVDRGSGVISSRKGVHIYSADLQKPLYISLFVHGGWVLEKDPVLVLDPSSTVRISSFWIMHQQSRRRLRVSIEYDLGENNAAPKAIRFFVPYWIVNDTYLPLGYRVVELEYSENADPDSLKLRASKSAKILRNPTPSRKYSSSRRNIQVLELLEDSGHVPSMLSPQDYFGGNALLFSSQKDAYISPKVGIGVAVHNSDIYSPGISLLELENKERVDVKAYSSDGCYYKLSAHMKTTSDRTKVVHFQPHTLFINRVGYSICLQQCDSQKVQWIHPTDPPRVFSWGSSAKAELLKLRVDGYKWSSPFSVSAEGVMRVCLQKEAGGDSIQLRTQVRSGTKSSRYEVIFRPNSFSSPYRIENRSLFLPIHFRQENSVSDSWQFLLPNAAASFFWDDVGKSRVLEVLVGGTDAGKSEKYNIDEISDYQPIHVEDGPIRALRVTVLKEEKLNVVRITDWMPESEPSLAVGERLPSPLPQLSGTSMQQQPQSTTGGEFHFILDFAELGISLVDHTPEEILYLSVQNLMLAYSTGLGSGISRFKIRLRSLQVDNQLPLTPMPVLFRPQRVGDDTDYVFKLSVTQQSNGSLDLCIYPYIGIQGPENSAFLINIHEPIIWRLHEMIQQVNLSRLYDTQTTSVSVDPIIQIGVLDLSEVRFKISMTMSPGQRPRGVLGFWSSLMTALGNTENMPVKINQRFHENVSMRQSSMISNATLSIRKDLLSQPLQLLSGVDILGNASSALGHMSKGVAALSMDKKFIQSRQRQENKGVEDIGDVIREGGGALAKGLFRGVTGILTKPLEGAKSSGVEGFVQGVGKGIIGAAAQPVSGVLDLLSKTTEGANAMRMKILAAITSEDQLLRRRLPRVIGGDNLLRPYDEYKAEGQVILQLAECGSFFGQVDLFKVRGKFALSDAFEDHFILPKGKIVVITHRRVILLQQTSNIVAQKKFNPARDPCSVLWDVLWDDLVIMELTHGKKDGPDAPPSRLILYLKARSPDYREQIRKIKCSRDTHQAQEVYSAIELAMNTYGPAKLKGMLKDRATKPYSPSAEGTTGEVAPRETVGGMWSPQPVPMSSTFGSNASS